jgi:hypothetical protein
LQAAVEAAAQEVKPAVQKQYPFDVALQIIRFNPKLATQVAALAVGMATQVPERVPLDLLRELHLHAKNRPAFAKFLFRQMEIYESMLTDRHLTLDDEKALQDYLDHVRRQSQFMPLPLTRHHSLGERTDVDANDVFVPLTLHDLDAGQPKAGGLKVDGETNRPATFAEIFNRHQCFLLKGPPGCGKTTLLHRSALVFTSGTAQTDLGWTGPVLLPIFLRLRNFGVFLAEHRDLFIGPEPGALTAFMENHFREERRLSLSAGFFDRRLK